MTREEAIQYLNKLYTRAELTDVYGDMEDMTPYEEALDMAIQALEQEPCEDAISRQEILNKINEVCFGEKWKGFRIDYGSNGQRDFLIDYIKQMSSVTPQEPKTGEWIADVDGYMCSECGVFNTDDDNLCPNCGADMRGDAESEE